MSVVESHTATGETDVTLLNEKILGEDPAFKGAQIRWEEGGVLFQGNIESSIFEGVYGEVVANSIFRFDSESQKWVKSEDTQQKLFKVFRAASTFCRSRQELGFWRWTNRYITEVRLIIPPDHEKIIKM